MSLDHTETGGTNAWYRRGSHRPWLGWQNGPVTSLLRPFTGFLPASEFAHRIVGPPVSTLSPDQREVARLDPLSFRHVVGRGAGSDNEEAQQWLRDCEQLGALNPVGPAVFVHRMHRGDFTATGIIANVSLEAYNSGRVKRHENTLAKSERKMAKYMAETRIYGNPVALAHRSHGPIEVIIDAHIRRQPDLSFVAADEIAHALWMVDEEEAETLCATYDEALYITDGHHRLAAAARVAAEEQRVDAYVPAAFYAEDQLRLRAFARAVVDPTMDAFEIIDKIRALHRLEEVRPGAARPSDRFKFGVKVGGRDFVLHLDRDLVPDDLYDALDVNLLQELVLSPVFGIEKPRKDERLHFLPDSSDAAGGFIGDAWFLPYPSSIDDVMAVADMGKVMPPKSTWFAPKIPSGLVIQIDR